MSLNLVLMPGFMGKASDFDALQKALPAQVACTVLDLPRVDDTQLDFRVLVHRWFAQQRPALPAKFHLYGYSLGGRLAMAAAEYLQAEEPGALHSLILESANPGLKTDAEKQQRLAQDKAWAARFSPLVELNDGGPINEVLQAWYQQPVFSHLTTAQIDALIIAKRTLSGGLLAKQLMAFSLGRQPNFTAVLKELALPVTFFAGDKDIKFSAIGQSLTGVAFRPAENAGHNIHFEQPVWLAKQITSLLMKKVEK